jgi:hypothetical protein
MSIALEETFRCPTCRASQELSDTCRRCKSDLRLVQDTLRTYRKHRACALSALQSAKPAVALRHARECVCLDPNSKSLELLALCSLCWGDWSAAAASARKALELEDL